jgi:tRNA (Thr-GGU) A37 N-methylase
LIARANTGVVSQGASVSVIVYHPIGIVECPITEPLRPEVIRAVESRLVLEPRFAPAVAALGVGQHLLVVYHLHRVEEWQGHHMDELFTRRIAPRPNPIGVTLTRVVALSGSIITVVGLDAINSSPILDIKPYKPVFDAPPVHPSERKP